MSNRRAETSSNQAKVQAKVIVVTADAVFEDSIRATFGTSTQVGLDLVPARLADCASVLDLEGAAVVIADVETAEATELEALDALVARAHHGPPIIAITESFDAGVARRLMQMRVADFLVKPVPPIELVRTCARVAKSASEQNHKGSAAAPESAEAQIFTFLPAVGGAGVTTLAVANGDAASQQRRSRQDRDLSGRSRFSARCLCRLSRH